MVAQREPSSEDFRVITEGLDLSGAENPLAAVNGLIIPPKHVLLPAHAGATEFSVSLNPDLPPQIDSRHQIYFADLAIGSARPFPVAIKTYNPNNGPQNWRREVGAYDMAKRSGLNTLEPVMIANFGRGVLMATRYDDELFDLERRYRGMAPEGYEIDVDLMLSASASALAALHGSDVIHGDMAPRNIALRRKDAQHPVVTDPETFMFPGELDADELAAGKRLDLLQLIKESTDAISINGGNSRVIPSRESEAIRDRVTEKIMPVYQSGIGHSFRSIAS
ncbi:MAG: hypothetical protein JWO47_1015 [Candidatus Saccharibacteria bacterium]|nr:hypothetical protein [Candidatus Saccharibacteria bacterium]